MSAELYFEFKDAAWYLAHRNSLLDSLTQLGTFAKRIDEQVWLRGAEADESMQESYAYDVRVFLFEKRTPMVEISAHPPSIERDLHGWLEWLRQRTSVRIVDEDGDESTW